MKPEHLRSVGLLVGFLALSIGVAALGGLATAEGVAEWYPTLDKPPWTPPRWVFGPVWTTLYTLMAVAAWDVARRGDALRPLVWWGAQLALNLLWSPTFFAWRQVGAALVVITLLWAALLGTILAFRRRSALAAGLLVPYLLWVTIAWSLNAWIWRFD